MCTKQSQPPEAVHPVRFCPFRGWPGSRMGTQRNMTGAVINNPLMSNENNGHHKRGITLSPHTFRGINLIYTTLNQKMAQSIDVFLLLLTRCYVRYREILCINVIAGPCAGVVMQILDNKKHVYHLCHPRN